MANVQLLQQESCLTTTKLLKVCTLPAGLSCWPLQFSWFVECVSACRPSWSFHCLPCDQLNPRLLCCLQAVFVLPTAYPVTSETLNYSGVAVGIVLFGSLAWWFFPIKSGRFAGARYWYTGGPNMSRQCFFKRCCKSYLESIY